MVIETLKLFSVLYMKKGNTTKSKNAVMPNKMRKLKFTPMGFSA